MNYKVLASKWRPKTFSDVVGQEHVLTAIMNGLSLGRIHHAYLFSGIRGVGKTSIARLLAKGLSCETSITVMPCSICNNCREIEQGRFVDLIEIDAASRTKVEDTRDLLNNIQYAPVRGRFKIYLIDEIHMLSRQSFNALLKTLEEPPAHVKFLLATTDPKKIPVTILSRCLQFHLKALDVEQILVQLQYILDAENIVYELRAAQLLANAADGSLRDALSLTDQAIAIGNGKITTEAVSKMLGILNNDQALSIIEAIIDADGERTLLLINAVATYGIEWEMLLVEMLSLLHRLAMLQLSPSAINADMAAIEQRLRKLASTVSPNDIQLYYQTLLVGRKELPFAPNRRMGVEMTLLRALAFHPSCIPLQESEIHRSPNSITSMTMMNSMQIQSQETSPQPNDITLSNTTNSILAARNQLRSIQEKNKPKNIKSKMINKTSLVDGSNVERLALITKCTQITPLTFDQKISTKKKLYCQNIDTVTAGIEAKLTISKLSKKIPKHAKTSELLVKIAEEAIKRDVWTAEISKLHLPKIIEQLALNTWKEQKGNRICLHLRSSQRNLNSINVQKVLNEALTKLKGTAIKLTIIEDDNFTVRTPLEWCQAIYEEKLAQAHEVIIKDNNIQILNQLFDANLDEESIFPL